jgi:hypothetical protein
MQRQRLYVFSLQRIKGQDHFIGLWTVGAYDAEAIPVMLIHMEAGGKLKGFAADFQLCKPVQSKALNL